MAREISSGGVVVRQSESIWLAALIQPQKDGASAPPRKRTRAILALPKGLVDPGETPEATAVREVHEETGLVAQIVTKLTDIKYVYTRTWGDRQRVFKIVSFYLLRYLSGEIDDLTPAMRIEVQRALWVPLAEAEPQLVHSNERMVLRQARQYLESYGLTPQVLVQP